MARQPLDAEPQSVDVREIARCHRLCLPDTASSRAGLVVLENLYQALLVDPAAHVVWDRGPSHASDHGAFAAGTVRYRETEAQTQRALSTPSFMRLALRVAAMPSHVLARRRWESLIPQEGIGYILTLGVASAVVPSTPTRRGRELLADLEAWFSAQGASRSFVDTELSNRRAHAFYTRAGYLEVSRDYGQVLLQKPLGSATG